MKKILVTLGPSSMNEKIVQEIAKLDIYVFRINLSHTKIEDVEEKIKQIQSWTDVPVCLDSEGAQLRNGPMVNENVSFIKDSKVKISLKPVIGNNEIISFNPINVSTQFDIGDVIQIDFNHVKFEIIEKKIDCLVAIVKDSGTVGSNKAADINRDIKFDPLTKKDHKAIKIGLKNGIKNFAMSFANQAKDVELMRSLCGDDANIICKIESPSGLVNLEGIISHTDSILIDRGDLSRRIPIEHIPFLQRRIISTSRHMNKPVFVATNLLESMITTKSPTRAEVNDVVSTLEMGGDGLVLAAETAIGNYPVQSVGMIRRLIEEFEKWTPNTSIEDLIKGNNVY